MIMVDIHYIYDLKGVLNRSTAESPQLSTWPRADSLVNSLEWNVSGLKGSCGDARAVIGSVAFLATATIMASLRAMTQRRG